MLLGIVLKVKARQKLSFGLDSPGKFKKSLLESGVAQESQSRSQRNNATKLTPFTDLNTVAQRGRET